VIKAPRDEWRGNSLIQSLVVSINHRQQPRPAIVLLGGTISSRPACLQSPPGMQWRW